MVLDGPCAGAGFHLLELEPARPSPFTAGLGEKRQRQAVETYAKRAGIEIVDEFYDTAVSGADPIEERPGFSALLDRIETNGFRTVVVEDASRLARSVLVQELAILALKAREVRVFASNGDDLTERHAPDRGRLRAVGEGAPREEAPGGAGSEARDRPQG